MTAYRISFGSLVLTLLAALGPTSLLCAQSQPPALPTDLDQLHAILESEAPRLRKIEVCKRLAAIGSADSVSALAALLTDEDLSHAARIGLEAITHPDAAQALRAAVGEVDGKLLIGVLNSLGARRDARSISLLEPLLKAPDPQVAGAAALALGRIGTDDAAGALVTAFDGATAPEQVLLARGSLIGAEVSYSDGRSETATRVWSRIRDSEVPRHFRLAAVRGLLLTRTPIDTDLFQSLICGKDPDDFAMALIVAREHRDNSVIRAIAALWKDVSEDRQVLLLAALGDRGDPTALPTILKATQSERGEVRSVAIRCMAQFSRQSVCPPLLAMAADSDAGVSGPARDALVLMPDPEVNGAILKRLGGADSNTRIMIYGLIGRRHIADGVPSLLAAADAKDPAERVAAIQALGETLPAEQLDVLTRRLTLEVPAAEQQAVKTALVTSCIRLGDSETCAKKIVNCLPQATGTLRFQLYELLGLVGGRTALEAITAMSESDDPEMQDTITRVLGQWMTPDAAPVLLKIAKSDFPEKFRIRALRGYVRILRQFDMTNRTRIQMCRNAMPLAKQVPERLLVLEALLRVPSRETLALAVTQLEVPEVRHRACEVTLLLGNSLADRHPDAVIGAMEKVLAVTRDDSFQKYARHLISRAKQAESRRTDTGKEG